MDEGDQLMPEREHHEADLLTDLWTSAVRAAEGGLADQVRLLDEIKLLKIFLFHVIHFNLKINFNNLHLLY
jgi:hypothetical protein